MANYLEDKLEQSELKDKNPEGKAQATLKQLCGRWGCVGGYYWMIEKKAPDQLVIKDMFGNQEVWKKDGEQVGTSYKDKIYKRTE